MHSFRVNYFYTSFNNVIKISNLHMHASCILKEKANTLLEIAIKINLSSR